MAPRARHTSLARISMQYRLARLKDWSISELFKLKARPIRARFRSNLSNAIDDEEKKKKNVLKEMENFVSFAQNAFSCFGSFQPFYNKPFIVGGRGRKWR